MEFFRPWQFEATQNMSVHNYRGHGMFTQGIVQREE